MRFFIRFLWFAGIGLAIVAPAHGQSAPVPDTLAPYVKEGAFDPGDFGWMKGRFADAGTADAMRWKSVVDYVDRCVEVAGREARRRLAEMGAAADDLPPGPYGDGLCSQVTNAMSIAAQKDDIGRLADRLIEARRLWDFARAGARTGSGIATFSNPEARKGEGWTLVDATFGEQFARKALSWARDSRNPALPPELAPLFDYLAWDTVGREDRKNTAWLRAYVAKNGWPTIGGVGPMAANAAWLLVQHADHDPAFQLEALRLMEPLVATGELNKSNYAYLYDRIMLKVMGKQRYATQFAGCRDGDPARPLRPMEDSDPARIDALRAEMGIGSLVQYREQMDRNFGPCGGTAR